jgi:hypothetical protein
METLGTARLTEEIPANRAVAAFVPRHEIMSVLEDPDGEPELLLQIRGGEPSTITIGWSRDALEELLARSGDETVVLTFDQDELSYAFSDVEAHGLRERALVFAVAAAGALGTGAGIAQAMPYSGDDGGPAAVTSIAAPAETTFTDASSGGYTAAAPAAATSGAESMVSDASSGAGYSAEASAADSLVTDASSGGGYTAAADASAGGSTVTDVSSTGGYTAAADASGGGSTVTDVSSTGGYTAAADASGGGSTVTDVSSTGGYGPVAPSDSSGEFLGIQAPSSTDAFLVGGVLLTIAGASFASRRAGTARPA